MNVCTCVYVFVLSDNVISVLLLKRDFALFFGCTECVNNFHIHSYIRNAVESTTALWGEDCVFQSSPCDWGMAPRQTALPGCDDWDRGTTAGPHRHHRQVQSLCMYLFIYGELKSVVKIMKSFSMPDDFYYCSDQQKASDSWFCTWLYAVIFTCVYLCYTCVISLIFLCILE